MGDSLPAVPYFDAGFNTSESQRHWKKEFEDNLEAINIEVNREKLKLYFSDIIYIYGEKLKKQLREFDIRLSENSEHETLK